MPKNYSNSSVRHAQICFRISAQEKGELQALARAAGVRSVGELVRRRAFERPVESTASRVDETLLHTLNSLGVNLQRLADDNEIFAAEAAPAIAELKDALQQLCDAMYGGDDD